MENQKDSPTAEKADKLASETENIRHLHSEKEGKGYAVEKGIRESKFRKVGFMDADLATDIEHTREAAEKLEDYSFVIGSRTGEGAKRAFSRQVPSLIFNKLLKLVFSSDIEDHQCGFKFFNKSEVESVMSKVENKHFFWDAELLVRAQREDISVYELEVRWQESGDSNVNVVLDGLKFLKEIIRLKKELVIK
ncbi:MAG: glycosyltransferase involved in cell wall biosynthesis [Candidatus Nanohaloarchaea archaeon]